MAAVCGGIADISRDEVEIAEGQSGRARATWLDIESVIKGDAAYAGSRRDGGGLLYRSALHRMLALVTATSANRLIFESHQ